MNFPSSNATMGLNCAVMFPGVGTCEGGSSRSRRCRWRAGAPTCEICHARSLSHSAGWIVASNVPVHFPSPSFYHNKARRDRQKIQWNFDDPMLKMGSVKPRVMTSQSSVNFPKTHLKTAQNGEKYHKKKIVRAGFALPTPFARRWPRDTSSINTAISGCNDPAVTSGRGSMTPSAGSIRSSSRSSSGSASLVLPSPGSTSRDS